MLEMQESDLRGRVEQTPSKFLEYLNLTPEEKAENARHGMRLFVKASKEFPGSVTVQGALIAGYCREEGIEDPLLLSECLTLDSEKVIRLILMAETVHRHAGKHGKIGNITLEKMRGVIKHDFVNAYKFRDFTHKQLDVIIREIGPKIERGNPKSEEHYFQEALQIPYIHSETHTPSIRERVSEHVLPKGREVLVWARSHRK